MLAFPYYPEGGRVYIGIGKNGNTVGVADPDADRLKIKDRIKNNISPSAIGLFDEVAEEKDGRPKSQRHRPSSNSNPSICGILTQNVH